MRPLRALIIYIMAVFLGGAVIGPWLYWLIHTFPALVGTPFHRYVHRAILGLSVIGLWPLLKALGMNSPRDLGIVRPAGQWRKFGGGVMLGFVSLAIIAELALVFGARDVKAQLTGAQIARKCLDAAGTAILVASVEEVLFRGALFGALRKAFHWVVALVLSSMVYAILHFLDSSNDPSVVAWYSGLELLPRMFANFANLHAIIPGFFNLTLAGILLGWAYQRTGNLSFSFGLHAGWIFWVKFYDIVTVAYSDANGWWWGTGKMAIVNGWLALPILAASLWVFAQLPLAKEESA